MIESVESPERIWIDSEGGCPYFYYEDELSYVGYPSQNTSAPTLCEPRLRRCGRRWRG